jgi:hypothetical protein
VLLKKQNIMKVIKQFYCIKDKKTYYVGNEYKGKRQDIKEYLEVQKAKQNKK